MSDNRQALVSKLAKARRQLQKAEALVADLELQLAEDQPPASEPIVELPSRTLEISEQTKDSGAVDAEVSLGWNKDDSLVHTIRDITERKVTEQPQQRSAAEYHDLYNNAPCGYHSLDRDGVIIQINDTELRWLGYDRDEVVGKLNMTDILTPAGLSVYRESFPRFKERGWVNDLELEAIRKDGSLMPILLNATAIIDEAGNFSHSRSSLFDITDLKRAQQALLESEARYRLLAENVTDVITKMTPDGIRTYITPSCSTLLGYRPEELIGRSAFEFIHSDDHLQTLTQIVEASNTGKKSISITQRLRHRDGRYIWVEVLTSIIRDPQTDIVTELVGVVRDISERKRNEAALDASFAEEHEFQNNLKALHEITIELTQIDDLDRFYKRVVELGRERLGFERLALFLYDSPNDLALGTYGTDEFGSLSDEHQIRFTPRPNAMLRRALEKVERFSYQENVSLLSGGREVGSGWNAAAVLWNGTHSLGWLVADNLLSQIAATKPLLDTMGLYALTVGTLLAQKQVQIAQRESEARYRLLADNLSDFVTRIDTSGIYLYVSPSCRTIFGYEPEELIGTSGFDLIHPDDVNVVIARQTAILDPNIDSSPLIYRMRHQQGHYVWVETTGKIIWAKDKSAALGFVTVTRDLTERLRVEEALRQSQQMLHDVIENIPISLCWKDRDSVYRGCNTLYMQMTGLRSLDEFVGKTDFELYPDKAEQWLSEDRGVMDSSQSIMNVEESIIGIDGHPHWLRYTKVALRDTAGKASGVLVTAEDITERRQVSAELERQSAFLRSVIDVSPNLIFVKDYDARFVLANSRVAQLNNTTVEAMIGKTDAALNPYSEQVDAFLEADRHVILTGQPLFMEEQVIDPLGTIHWFQTTKVPITGADGKSNYVLGVATEITERIRSEAALKESEAKYRSLVETMRGGLVIFGLDNRITFINDRFCELVGYSRDEVLGSYASDYVDPTNLPLLKDHLSRRRNLESTTYELLFRHKNGSPVYLLISGSPLLDQNGKPDGSFAVATDITPQKQAEAALRQALDKEKELSELKSRFVSMASHEFRTPLATILALTETLSTYRRKLTDEQIDQRFDKIKEQIDHLKDIMEDVLLLARMQARRVEFNPTNLDLDNLCRSVLDEFQNRSDIPNSIEYTCNLVNQQATLDKKLMRQVIANLVSNAVKYSPQGQPVRVSLEFIPDALILKISDQGIGIPEADLPHLFEPFHRAANVGTISGTGLGLVISKESVDLHGGTITVESKMNVGTIFVVTIPRTPPRDPADQSLGA